MLKNFILHQIISRRNKGNIYVKNIRKYKCRIRNRIRIWNQNNLKIRIRIRKNHFGYTALRC
jgi:hypothetical protein